MALVEAHGDALRRIARFYAGEDGEEEDLHQEILVQAWRSFPSFRGDASAGTWLYRVALNTALTWRRRAHRRSERRAPLDPEQEAGSVQQGSHESETAILAAFLDTLGGVDRSVLLLYMEGLSHREIADVTGLSAGAVGVRIHRMKQVFTDRFVER